MYEIVGRGVDLSTLWQGGHCSVLSPLDARVGECDLCPIVRYPLASLGCRRYRCRTGATRDPSPPCWYIILLVACLAPANHGKKDPNVATTNASSVCRRVGFLVVVEHSTRTTPGTLVHTHTHTQDDDESHHQQAVQVPFLCVSARHSTICIPINIFSITTLHGPMTRNSRHNHTTRGDGGKTDRSLCPLVDTYRRCRRSSP